jgi:predicted DNA-binding transcriptional regulator AlpA
MGHVLLRLPEVQRRLGNAGRSSVYDLVNAQLLHRPTRFGAKATGWLEAGLDEIIAARLAGKGDDEIRKIVARLNSGLISKEAA